MDLHLKSTTHLLALYFHLEDEQTQPARHHDLFLPPAQGFVCVRHLKHISQKDTSNDVTNRENQNPAEDKNNEKK
jgi:hypothetical protein